MSLERVLTHFIFNYCVEDDQYDGVIISTVKGILLVLWRYSVLLEGFGTMEDIISI